MRAEGTARSTHRRPDGPTIQSFWPSANMSYTCQSERMASDRAATCAGCAGSRTSITRRTGGCGDRPSTQASLAGAGGPAPGAAVFFPEKTFEFKPVIEGAKVIHDFVVTNRGSAPLVISDVRTG